MSQQPTIEEKLTQLNQKFNQEKSNYNSDVDTFLEPYRYHFTLTEYKEPSFGERFKPKMKLFFARHSSRLLILEERSFWFTLLALIMISYIAYQGFTQPGPVAYHNIEKLLKIIAAPIAFVLAIIGIGIGLFTNANEPVKWGGTYDNQQLSNMGILPKNQE